MSGFLTKESIDAATAEVGAGYEDGVAQKALQALVEYHRNEGREALVERISEAIYNVHCVLRKGTRDAIAENVVLALVGSKDS